RTRYFLSNGMKTFLVSNVQEVELLLMRNKTFAAEIAHNISSRNRISILARCIYPPQIDLGLSVTNPAARIRSEE
ncbi:ribosomal protein L32 protein, partial [Rickenella mellea]